MGKYVQITSTLPDGKVIKYVYAHLFDISIENGATVIKGNEIGTGGSTGNAIDVDVKHCHIQVKIDGVAVDPNGYMKTKFDSNGNSIK